MSTQTTQKQPFTVLGHVSEAVVRLLTADTEMELHAASLVPSYFLVAFSHLSSEEIRRCVRGRASFTFGVNDPDGIVRECKRMNAAVLRAVSTKKRMMAPPASAAWWTGPVRAAAVVRALSAWLLVKHFIISHFLREIQRGHGTKDQGMLLLQAQLIHDLSLVRRVLRAFPELEGQAKLNTQGGILVNAERREYDEWDRCLIQDQHQHHANACSMAFWLYVYALTKKGRVIRDRGVEGRNSIYDVMLGPAEAEEDVVWNSLAEMCSGRLGRALVDLDCMRVPAFSGPVPVPSSFFSSPSSFSSCSSCSMDHDVHAHAYTLHSLASTLRDDATADDHVLQAKFEKEYQNAVDVLTSLAAASSL